VVHIQKGVKMNTKKFLVILSILAVLLSATVLSAGAAAPAHVSTFKVSHVARQIKATVGVANALNKAISGAKVQVSFEKEGLPIILRNGLTNAFGRTTIAASVPAGKWLVCVEEIHKLGYTYNPAQNLCSTIIVP
jgi:hypothetical protein